MDGILLINNYIIFIHFFIKKLKLLYFTNNFRNKNLNLIIFLFKHLNNSVSTKFGVHMALYTKTIMNLGTEKHKKFIDNAVAFQDIGSFSLTELGHGSNIK